MLNRRKFIQSSSAAATSLAIFPFSTTFAQFNHSKTRTVPKRLQKGDVIGLITPGGPITKEQLSECIHQLEELGFNTYYEETVLSEYGYFAGKDQERADELMSMFSNKNVDGILCVRGGYGSIRILDILDFGMIRNNPKVFMGYSDITALNCSIFEKTGLVTYHGPLGISPFNEFTFGSFEQVVMDPKRRYTFPYQREEDSEENSEFDLYTINPGKADGKLIGGNISVLDSMIGSQYEPDFDNKIVFLEEIGEKTYRVDKMLFHLLSATNLKKAAGIVLGVFNDCNINDEPRLTLRIALNGLLQSLDIPIFYGMSFGHIDTILTIPCGIKARMNADKHTLKLLEKAVS